MATLFWYDYETGGTDPARDRVVQFAGQRTDIELNPVGEPVRLFCRPEPGLLPHPAACLITGISPQQALREGLPERWLQQHPLRRRVHSLSALSEFL